MNNKAHKTAIARKTLSVPMKYLNGKGLLKGRILEFGCGKGFDADSLNIEGYDPFHRPEKPEGKFNTVVCNYVLNVVTDDQVHSVLKNIHDYLVVGGTAYITVRRDIKKEGWTKIGTYQVNRELPFEVIRERKNAYIIYKVKKDMLVCEED